MATDYRALAVLAAQRYGINPQIFLRQINQESGFRPDARSSAGAEGIAQFMPSTAAGMHIDPMNPREALMAAAKMDAGNIAKYGGWAPALSAYNSGNPNAYKDPNFAGGQTYNYVRDIMGGKPIPMSRGKVSVGGPIGSLPGGGPGPSFASNPNLQLIAQMMLNSADQMAQGANPLQSSQSLLDLAMMRQQLGAAQQVYGPMPQQPTPQPVQGGGGAVHNGPTQAGGFLPKGASFKPGRQDQGQDFQTDPGAPILAPGSGVVLSVKYDPNGFGPAYPVVHFTSGPYAGKDVYIGHTIATVKPGQKFTAGTVLSHTGTHPIGNASVPGWAEIGYAPGGMPGDFGQSVPF